MKRYELTNGVQVIRFAAYDNSRAAHKAAHIAAENGMRWDADLYRVNYRGAHVERIAF